MLTFFSQKYLSKFFHISHLKRFSPSFNPVSQSVLGCRVDQLSICNCSVSVLIQKPTGQTAQGFGYHGNQHPYSSVLSAHILEQWFSITFCHAPPLGTEIFSRPPYQVRELTRARHRKHSVIVVQVWLLFHVLYKDINKWPELQKSVCWKPKPMYIISAVMSQNF